MANLDLIYRRDERPRSTGDWCLYVLQWFLTMFYAVVWGYAIVGVGLDFTRSAMTAYISAVVLTIGLSTLLQSWLGHRMGMLSGPNVIPSFAIVAAFASGQKRRPLSS